MVVLTEALWKGVAANRKRFFCDVNKSPEERLQAFLTDYCLPGSFSKVNGIPDCRVVRVDPSTNAVEIEVTITDSLCNRVDSFHGGAAATFMDDITVISLFNYFASIKEWYSSSLTRTLILNYLRPVMRGQTVRVICYPVVVGKRAANLYGEVRDKDGQICITCIHDVAIVSPSPAIAAKL